MSIEWTLDGKVAIVTGAARGGIGEAYAHTLAEAGASVVCADIDGERANQVSESIVGQGGSALAVRVDIADEASVASMVEQTTHAFGGVDILVNNAALMAQIVATPAMEYTREDWDRAFAVNVAGAWQCCKAVVPSMQTRGGGRIVNQSTVGAFPAETVYGITKLALVGLTTTMARELGPLGITVNCIAPGIVASDAGKSLTPKGSEFRDMVDARVALRSIGQPEELCGALMLFVASPGEWITGQVLNVDGGFVMR